MYRSERKCNYIADDIYHPLTESYNSFQKSVYHIVYFWYVYLLEHRQDKSFLFPSKPKLCLRKLQKYDSRFSSDLKMLEDAILYFIERVCIINMFNEWIMSMWYSFYKTNSTNDMTFMHLDTK